MAMRPRLSALLLVTWLGSCAKSPEPTAPIQAASPSASERSPRSEASFTKLAIDSVGQVGLAATVSGTTDLPDGSVLSVSIARYNDDPKSTYIGNEAAAHVEGGKWRATVPFPKVASFAKGPYEASVMFTPKAQGQAVLTLVGADGEKLKGPLVENKYGFSTMQTSKRTKLAVVRRAAPMPKPETYAVGDPRRAVAELLVAWKREDWSSIARKGTLSGASTVAERADRVNDNIAIRKLESARIVGVDTTGLVSRVSFEARCAVGAHLREETLKLIVLKVDDQGETIDRGTWRVNLALAP